jgi:hypothetical protein
VSVPPDVQIIGVFHDRDRLERAIEMLQSHGLERSQLSVLGTADAVRERLGLPVAEPADPAASGGDTPVDESEKQNMTPLLAGLPTYVGAVLAAGVAVASGGTLAGAAVAALLGGAGGGVLGASAAGVFRGAIEESYEDQLAKGGILLLVHPRTEGDVERARAVLAEHADRQVETAPDRTLT